MFLIIRKIYLSLYRTHVKVQHIRQVHSRTNPELLECTAHIAIARHCEDFAGVLPIHKDDIITFVDKFASLLIFSGTLAS